MKDNNYWSRYSTGSTFESINSNDIRGATIFIPKKTEQESIGSFLKNIDNFIDLNQRKLEQLQTLKKAYLQVMFPQKDETVPRLRFANFKGEWRQCKLEDVIKKQIKGKAKLDYLKNGTTEYLDANRLNGGEIIYADSNADVQKKDILILWDGSKAGSVYYGFEGVLGSTLKAYKMEENVCPHFVFQQLVNAQQIIYSNYRTPNIPHVVKNFTNIFSIQITTKEEQMLISTILALIDKAIEIQNKEIHSLKKLKKSYLQNMFI